MQKNESQKDQSAQQANSTTDKKNVNQETGNIKPTADKNQPDTKGEKIGGPTISVSKNDTAKSNEVTQNSQTSNTNARTKTDAPNDVLFNRVENQKYLETRLQYQGFDKHLNQKLGEAMDQGKPKFTLDFSAEFKGFGNKLRVVDYEVNFKKDHFTDNFNQRREAYAIDTVQATLRNELKPDESRTQTFYMDKSRGITAKEAFNMLEGRSVMKNLGTRENEKNTWLQLNFNKPVEGKKEFVMNTWSEKHMFDLEKSVLRSGVNIKNIDYDGVMESITKSLRKGDITPVLNKDTNTQNYLIADPRERNVRAYDSNMQRIGVGVKEYRGESKEQFQEKVQQAKTAKEDSNLGGPTNGKSTDSSKSANESKSNGVSKDDTEQSRKVEQKQSETSTEIQGTRQRRSRGVGV